MNVNEDLKSPVRFVSPRVVSIERENPMEKIELVARTCYKSEDHIKDGSAKIMFNSLVGSGHFAMLEHATVTIGLPVEIYYDIGGSSGGEKRNVLVFETSDGGFGNVYCTYYKNPMITANLRTILTMTKNTVHYLFLYYMRNFGTPEVQAIVTDKMMEEAVTSQVTYGFRYNEFAENLINKYVKELSNGIKVYSASDILEECNPMEMEFHLFKTVHIVCDRGVSHEFVRHRMFSFAQESTRYANYSKAKFGNQVATLRYPGWTSSLTPDASAQEVSCSALWMYVMNTCGEAYLKMINEFGATPQEARCVLPNSLKTELVMTGNLYAWKHFFDLRYFEKTGKAHPQAKKIAKMIYDECFSEQERDVVTDKA